LHGVDAPSRAIYHRHVIRSAAAMPVQVRMSGCLFSIIASLLLTLALNLLLRACT